MFGTTSYILVKFSVPLVGSLTTNEYPIKNFITFAGKLQSFDFKLAMTSSEIESVYTNVLLQDMFDLCVEHLFRDRTHINNTSKDPICEMLKKNMFESSFVN